MASAITDNGGRERSNMSVEQTTFEAGNSPSLANLLQVLLRRLWVIVLMAIVLGGSAVGFSLTQTPTYEASTKILIGQQSTDDAPGPLSGNVQGLQDLTPTMAKAVTTRPVAQAVVERLRMPEESAGALLNNLSAQQDPGTMFIDVSYRDSDPKRAQLVANTVGQVFSERISDVSLNANGVTATMWEEATLPPSPISPDPARNGILALALGILLGVGLAFLLEYLDDGLDSPEEAERVSGVTTLGTIPRFKVLVSEKGKQ